MEQASETKLGMNKTGALMSPIDSKLSYEGAQELTIPPEGNGTAINENRIVYMKESGSIGTVPVPGTFKGLISSLQEKLTTGNHAFIDKLGERLAFERTGTRLYEGILTKYHGTDDKSALPPLALLEKFYNEELLHFYLVTDVMKELGGDPTAVTPAANINAVASQGWVQVMADPRTSFAQSLEIILQAELVDNAGWELLITLAEEAGLTEISQQFRKALEEEAIHLQHVRDWVTQLNLGGRATIDIQARQ